MKNIFKLIGIFALTAIIGLSMVTCNDEIPDDNGGKGGGNGSNNNTPQTPIDSHFNISGTGTVYFDPSVRIPPVTVTAQSGKTTGAVTVCYEGTGGTSYPKVDAVPVFFGTYKVTFDVAAATGWNAATGLSAGTLTIADGTPATPTGLSVAIASANSLKASWTSVPRATSYKVYYITNGTNTNPAPVDPPPVDPTPADYTVTNPVFSGYGGLWGTGNSFNMVKEAENTYPCKISYSFPSQASAFPNFTVSYTVTKTANTDKRIKLKFTDHAKDEWEGGTLAEYIDLESNGTYTFTHARTSKNNFAIEINKYDDNEMTADFTIVINSIKFHDPSGNSGNSGSSGSSGNSGNALKLAGTVNTNSFTHTGLTLNIDDIYFYYVIAVNSSGESDYSDFKSFVIDKPIAPASVQATAASDSKIDLKWSSVSNATEYEVYYSTTNNSGSSSKLSGTFTSASASLTGATAKTTYYFWVKAKNPFGTSDFSPVGSTKTFMVSNWQAGLKTGFVSSNEIGLSWAKQSVDFALNYTYYLYCATDTPDNFKVISYGSPALSFYTHSVSPNSTYYYYVTLAVKGNMDNPSYMSETIKVQTGSPPPPPPPTPPAPPPAAASEPPSGGGSGQKECNSCHGSGKCNWSYSFGLSSCSGGYADCTTCGGTGKKDSKTCTTCNGAKKVKCTLCGGSGKCKYCGGSGKK